MPVDEALLDRVDAAAAAVLRIPSGPAGVVVGVATAAGTRVAALGAADGAGRPVGVGTRFDVASVSKVVATTTAIQRLASDGLVNLDDPVDRYAPGICNPSTTVSMLLRHRAGLWEWQPLYLARNPDGTSTDPFDALAALPLRYRPDTVRAYSDLGFIALGRLVERVSGLSLPRAVADLVTGPLAMRETTYGPVDGDVAASAPGDGVEQEMIRTGTPYPVLYPPQDLAWRSYELVGEVNDGNCHRAFRGVSGHAGIFSTAGDLLLLGRSLAQASERSDLWRPAITERMFDDGPDLGQAMGWRSQSVLVAGTPHRMLWHPGFTGCALGLIPGLGVSITLLSNRLLADTPQPTATLWATALESLGIANEGSQP